jgi:integrase
MKAKRPHRVPLSGEALAVLAEAEARRSSDYQFNGAHVGKPLSDTALLKKLHNLCPGTTTHGMRSAFRDWCAEHGVARELAKAALAHMVRDTTERAYLRGDVLEPRRAVMQRWADFLTAPAAQQDSKVAVLDEMRVAVARCRAVTANFKPFSSLCASAS